MLYLIVNEQSRTGKAAPIWKEVQDILRKREIGYQAYLTKYEGHALSLAAKVSSGPEDDICIVVLGGDGTVNEVINGITNFEKVRFGLIPTGSGNDFARGLGLLGTTEENLNRILGCMEKGPKAYCAVDLGQVSYHGCEKPRLFAISAGIGMDASVCKKTLRSKLKKFLNKIHLGKLTYLILTVQTLFGMDTADASSRFDGKGTKNLKKMIFTAAMNFRAEGGGVPMAPGADAQDGKLSVCTAYGIPKWKAFLCLPLLVAARHEGVRGFEITNCSACNIHISKPMALHADGEYCGDTSDVVFTCLPGQLHVMK